MLTSVLVAIAAIVIQSMLHHGPGRRMPIGDENEYIERANAADPFGPLPFLRVPMMAVFVKLAAGKNTERWLRVALAVIAVVTALLVAMAGHLAHGPQGALVCGLLFLLLPDRMILSQHIWPDVLLALWQSVLLCLLIWPGLPAPLAPWMFGAVAAVAVLTRIDALVLLPALTLHPTVLHAHPAGPAVLAVWLPSVVALVLLSIVHARRYGIALPDSTVLFNVTVLEVEQRDARGVNTPVEAMIRTAVPLWQTGSHADRVAAGLNAAAHVVMRPWCFLRGVARRVWQMMGADTFAVECLLDKNRGAYPDLNDTVRRAWVRALRMSFPLLLAFATAGMVASPAPGTAYLLPSAAVYLAACVVHTRTRFRYALLPALCLAGTSGLLALAEPASRGSASVVALVAALILFRAPARTEYAAPSST